jgi:hypothetical protein
MRAGRATALLVLSTLLAFAAAELFVRARYQPVDLMVLTGRKAGPNPMRDWAQIDAFSAYRGRHDYRYAGLGKTINDDGFISTPPIAREKPPGTLRVAFLGGSSTAGTGNNLADADTWPWRTIERLRARYPERRFDFINAALGGYSSFESFGRLWSRLRFYDPDIVVVDHAWNEMYYFREPDRAPLWHVLPDGSWSFDTTYERVQTVAPRRLDHYIRWSQLLVRLRVLASPPAAGEVGAAGARPTASALADAKWDERGPRVFRTNLRLLDSAAAVLGVDLLVVKQPTLIVANLSEADRARCMYRYHGFGHDEHLRAFAAVYAVIDEVIPPERVIDLTPLSGRGELFGDHVHPTVAGAREIARRVAAAIEGWIEGRDARVGLVPNS